MRILHLCLSAFYIDGYSYQENNLPRINKEDGHEVMILASTETFIDNSKVGYLEPSTYETEYGVTIKRLPYVKVGNHLTTVKLRKYLRLYEEIATFAPDVIFCHNTQFWSALDVIRYKKKHSEVKLYADTHVAGYNSGTNWLSLHVLHRVFYRYLVQRMLPYLEKYFYVGASERDFAEENYGVPREMLEYYPLGGNLLSDTEYTEKRNRRREELGLEADELLLLHSGKLDALKRTDELIQAFKNVPELKAKLAIIGSIPVDRENVLLPLIQSDQRVVYLGWKTADQLQEYLCACDLYCQPGSVSATMQNSVCCNCPVMTYPHKPYTENLDFGNILWIETQDDMVNAFRQINNGQVNLEVLRSGSQKCAQELLDYRKLATRIYR